MLHDIHEHINQEIRLNTRTDTIFVITAMIFNFIMMAGNSGFAAAAGEDAGVYLVIFFVNTVVSIIVNGVSVVGLLTGRSTRMTLMQGLMKLYTDEEVVQYYHPSLLTNYTRRYVMFIIVVGVLGFSSVFIPLSILLFGI